MFKTLRQTVIALILAAHGLAQSDSGITSTTLATYINGNYSGNKLYVLPTVVAKVLPKVLIVERRKEISIKVKSHRLASLIRKSKLFSATQYIDLRPRRNNDGTVSVTYFFDEVRFPGIEFNGARYVFAGAHCDTSADARIFNLFLKEADLRIESEKEAIELANLYLSITRGYFENQGKLILSGVEDVPPSYRNAEEAETNRLREIVAAPKSTRVGDNYEVELYTWEIFRGEVSRWTFKIQSDAHIEVQSEIIGKL